MKVSERFDLNGGAFGIIFQYSNSGENVCGCRDHQKSRDKSKK